MEFQLTNNQQQIFDRIERTQDNIFVTGKPGVGKSVLIRALVEAGQKHYVLAAPTGLAALNIGGKTLHSIFRIPVSGGILHPTFNNFTNDDSTVKYVKYGIKCLIIDEVSMVRADMFDYIDRFMRFCKEVDEPFGGAQIVIVGDFYQLPPVVPPMEKVQLKDAGYASEFAFDAKAYNGFEMMELSEVLRQKGDDKFIDILHAARTGDVTNKQVAALNEHVSKPKDLRINLASTNKMADEINTAELRKLPEPTTTYQSVEYGSWPAYPVEKVLSLKVGAQIMVRMNKADKPVGHRGAFDSKVVNGTLGKVIELHPDKVNIQMENGDVATIYRQRWERKVKEQIGDKWVENVVASYEQIPLSLAWAISMHKSQGQSFDKVYIDMGKIFAAGQAYVALSRVRSLAGLSLESKVTSSKFYANKSVVKFFNQVEI